MTPTASHDWKGGLVATFAARGIGRRFAIYILLFSSVITLIITAVQLIFDYRHDVGVVEGRLGEIEVVYRDTLSTAVWVHNSEGLRLQLVGILRLPDMLYIRVDDEHGDPLASLGTQQDKLTIERSFALSYPHRGSLMPLGTVTLCADLGAVYQRLLGKVVVILVSQTIKTFLVSLFILLLFYRLVGRHLHDLAAGAHDIGAGSLALLPPSVRDDELGELSNALNKMITALSRSGEEIGRLAAVMAHQFQEPTRLMAIFAQRLRKSAGYQTMDPASRESLDFIESEARRLRNLVTDMQLYLACWQAAPTAAMIDSGQVFQETLSKFARSVDQAAAEISIEALPPVRMDRKRLADLFTVLLDNALKHRRPGLPLAIHLAASPAGRRSEFRFADNGPGIPHAQRDKVFQLFERLSSGNEGTGVGLSVAKKIVETAGGQVRIEDSALGGTCVVFDLPT